MWSAAYVILGVVVLLPTLWLLASLTQNLWIPAVVLGIALLVYLLGQLLEGLQLNIISSGNTTATLSQTVDALELELLKAEWREIKEQLLGDAEISGGRLSKAMATLKNFSRMDAKVQEVRDVIRMLEQNHTSSLEEILLRQLEKGQALADFAVERLAEELTKQDFWSRLAPQLLAAGIVQHLDSETLVQMESEKAKVQEQLRIDRGIPQSLETIRVRGWIELYEAMAQDFDRALPYRAAVFLAVCAALFGLALLYHFMKRRLKIPTLVDETSVSWLRRPKALPSICEVFAGDAHRMDRPKVVLREEIRHSVEDMALVAMKRSRRGMALPNAVFFGPPGTGKSLTARRLAECCGMDYAILSGGNILGLKEEAVPELRRVFAWARRSLRGLLIFIDEAEAFLCSRSNQSNAYVQAALSFFLAQTGSSSSRFQLILATNRVQDLDPAILSRVPLRIEFGRPDAQLLEQQVQDRVGRLEPVAGERLSQLLKEKGEAGTAGEALYNWKFTGRDVQGLFEEFARRWSLEQELGRKADKEWLDRWFNHRALT
ncbi:unnamed protein product [Cladocopium goreaui]|uniref:ATPase family AAA domain-containing protein 3A homolog (Belphegor protein) n=1 Tax=Cladocopium goreaui TaxID=2562237 RepID=A0A9P1BU11_9DINO|nr:unnamed protein product [Cladocopium goreaui]